MAIQFRVSPCSENCETVYAKAEHITVGLSPFNGYYKPRMVEALVSWAATQFAAVDVFTPGYEAALTLTAAGFDPPEAVHLARRAVKHLRGAAVRALSRDGVPEAESRVHSWTQLANRAPYARLHQRARQAYRHDPALRRSCRTAARQVLRTHGVTDPADRQVDEAAAYAVAELPLVADGPAIFGTPSSLFIYHRPLSLIEPLLTGEASVLTAAAGQGYAIVTPEPEPEHASDPLEVSSEATSRVGSPQLSTNRS